MRRRVRPEAQPDEISLIFNKQTSPRFASARPRSPASHRWVPVQAATLGPARVFRMHDNSSPKNVPVSHLLSSGLWTHSAYWQLPELPPSRKRSGRLVHRVERSRDDHGWPDCRSPFTARRHHVDAWVRHLGLDPQPRTGRPAGPATIAELRPPPGGRVDCPLPGGQRPPAEVSEDPACLWAAVRRTVSGYGRFGRGRELAPFAFPPPCAPGHPRGVSEAAVPTPRSSGASAGSRRPARERPTPRGRRPIG